MEPKKASDPDELGGWRINGRLGEGGFGTVYLGEKGAQKAAIKVIRPEFVEEDDARNRLATEASILSKLSDPFIGKILDSDLSGKYPWIATEFINGPTLDAKVNYEGPLDEIAWFNLAANIFHAIVTSNELGIIHKDIKPSNIILGETGNKLIDFGIAHISGQTRTAILGDREGSTPFSSPEHFTIRANPKMDVFSTAATLAFAGKRTNIWNGENDLQLMRSINEDTPNLEGLTENQTKFLTPLFEKNPSDRPSALEAHQSALGYIEFLLGKSKKPIPPRGIPIYRKALRSSKALVLGLLILIPATLLIANFASAQNLISSIFNSEGTKLANECRSSLQNGNLDLAVESCFNATAAGMSESNPYLARAYLANKSNLQAETVLKTCKGSNASCLSDYAFYFQSGDTAIKSLKLAYSKGDIEAPWRIGALYAKKDEISTALDWYQIGSKANNAMANIYLSLYWSSDPINNYKKALTFAKMAIGGDLSGAPDMLVMDNVPERLIESLYTKSNDNSGKISFFTDCASKKSAFCIETLANAYLVAKDFVNAKKWGLIGADINNAKSMWVLSQVERERNGLLPKGTSDPSIDDAIFKWYTKAAELGDVKSAMALAIGYSFGIGKIESDLQQSCIWLQKGMARISDRKGSWKEEPSDVKEYAQAAQFFELQNCQSRLLGDTPVIRFASPTPSPSKANTATPMPSKSPSISPSTQATSKISDGNLAPVLQYKTSEYSEKISSDVKTTGIFGRAYLRGSDWIIPLTNSGNESVPPINRVQFRDSSLPYGSWWNMPYELTDSGSTGWQAVVSNLGIQILHSTGKKVCPEFRLALVQNGLVTYIWTKSVEPCTVP
jgi:serine/threonine protein kinase/TPR repeat protein